MAPEPLRTPAPLVRAVLFLTLLLATPAHGLRVVNYNILNYPGTTGATRDPLFRTILAPLNADILCVQEMQSDAGCTQFLGSLNTMEPGQWARAAFDNGPDTDSGLFYKPSKLQLIGQGFFFPNSAILLRYIHYYRLMPVGYTSPAAEIRVYALHLKASQGFEAQRAAEATGLRDTLNAVIPGTHSLVMGDFNLYHGTEPALTKLLESQADNDGRLYDPLGLQGISWQDNTSIKWAWTQSPCKTGDTGCGPGAATGGIDDRFDLILPTLNWNDGVGLELIPGTYVAVGNDGQHWNNSIQDAPTIPEGAAYASALHAAADHLPVRVDLRLPARASVPAAPIAFGTVIAGATASALLNVTNAAPAPGEALTYSYTPPTGFTAPLGPQSAAAGVTNQDAIALDTSAPGNKSGALAITSNSVEGAIPGVALSGTVLRHASASLDSLSVQASGSLDFGTQAAGEFEPMDVRVHNQAYDALQARLSLTGAGITGGAGRFSVQGTTPQLLAGTGATFTVAFDAAGATTDSAYTATLTFTGSDEALPGAQPAAPVIVDLSAEVEGGGTVSVGPFRPTVTVLRPAIPNPLANESRLSFDLAHAGEARLEVFDAAGRRVATLLDSWLEPDVYSVSWNGRGDGGEPLGAGLYFVRLTAQGAPRHAIRLAIVR